MDVVRALEESLLSFYAVMLGKRHPTGNRIAGGTGSGKSTFTNRLKDAFGDQVTVLYHDNYYRAHDDMPFEQRKKLNYDHPDAFETELLLEHLIN